MPQRPRRSPRRVRHCIEALEQRLLLSTTWTVASTADDGSASTLRYAITHAAAGDAIQFEPTAFAAGSPHTITLAAGQLEIGHNLTIQGPGSDVLAISGNNASRVFLIDSGVTANLSGLTIANGNAGTGNAGGGISNSGTLDLASVVITANAAGFGGGIYTQGVANLTGCTLSNNSASTNGGGIDTHTSATLIGCTVTNNRTASGSGGGILDNGGTVTLINDTITANSDAGGSGGGVANVQGGNLTIANCTIAANAASNAGGGIYLASGSATINNTAVAQDTYLNSSTPNDVSGTLAGSYNLIGDGSGGLSTSNHNLLGSTGSLLDPKLGSLSNNGGPTLTMLPQTGSPLIDAGSNALVPTGTATDQRGYVRIVNGTVDRGAVEYGAPLVIDLSADSGTLVLGAAPDGGIKIVVNGAETDYPAGAFGALQLSFGHFQAFNILATVVPTTVNGPSWPASLSPPPPATVGSAGSLQGIAQPLNMNGYPNILDDSADKQSRHVMVEPDGSYLQIVHGLAPADITGGGTLEMPAAGGNQIDVMSSLGTDIVGHTPVGAVETINFQAGPAASHLYVDHVAEAGAGTDAVTVDDSQDTAVGGIGVDAYNVSGLPGPGQIEFDQPASISALTIRCGNAGNTVGIGPVTGMTNGNITVDTGLGNDTVNVTGVDAGATVNVNGQGGQDNVSVYFSPGRINVSNTAGSDTLTMTNSAGSRPRTLDTYVPAGSSDTWQRVIGSDGGEVDYDAAQMAGAVTINDTGVLYTILNTPSFPARTPGATPTPTLELNIQGPVTIDGAGANAVIDATDSPNPVVDFSTGTFGDGATFLLGSSPLNLRGANPADAFTIATGQITHGSTLMQFAGNYQIPISISTGTYTIASSSGQAFPDLGTLTVNGPGATLVLPGGTAYGSYPLNANVNGGRVTFAPTPAGQVTYSGIRPYFTNGGQMDVGNDALFFQNFDARTWIASGYNNGAWNGTGIISSTLSPGYGLGYKYYGVVEKALIGDTNLDGTVNLADFLALSHNFGTLSSNWSLGDFNYDGKTNLTDLLALIRNFGKSIPPTPAAQTALGAADDPIIGPLALRRRR